MKIFIAAVLLSFTALSGFQCRKEEPQVQPANCLKGRLEKKGICANYTISVVQGGIDPSLVEADWQDPNTKITYHKAFRLASPCAFPTNLKEGDEFYFQIDPSPSQDCVVCQAWYPTPSKSLAIKVLNGPCQ